MKVKKDALESIQYVIMCVLSLGIIYGMRIIISQAIRMALEAKPEMKKELEAA